MAEFTLEEWRKTYSYPEDITQNETVNKYYDTENNTVVNGDKNQGQINLITGNAVGTEDNYYLDPNPLFNTLGQIYSTIVNSGFESARTDAIKMNRDNMDYTNGDNPNTLALKLLMPQYKRRVEVEDLNENFWVISQLLGAAVNALWGPYGLIDVVRRLIAKVTSIENFLGLNDIEKIELLHDGNNDVYFDMYSRFTLSELGLRLKTRGGERIIDNIFTPHNEKSDRAWSTPSTQTRKDLFKIIQNYINYDGKIYDSDIISSRESISDNGGFISLNTVIDAINDKLVSGIPWTAYEYTDSEYREFLRILDLNSNGTLTTKELQQIEADVKYDLDTVVLGTNDLKRFERYRLANEWLSNMNLLKPDYPYKAEQLFQECPALASTKALGIPDEDDDGVVSNDEFLNYGNEQLLRLYNELVELDLGKDIGEALNEYKKIQLDVLQKQYISLCNNFNFNTEDTSKDFEFSVLDINYVFKFFGKESSDGTFKPEFVSVNSIYYGDIYNYSLNVQKMLASELLETPIIYFDENVSLFKGNVIITDNFKKEYFDLSNNGDIDLYDNIIIGQSNLQTLYNKKVKQFVKLIEDEEKSPTDNIYQIKTNNLTEKISLKKYLSSIMNMFYTESLDEYSWDAIKAFYLIYLGTIEESLTSLITIYQPTSTLLEVLQTMTNPSYQLIGGMSIPDEEVVLASIKNTSYELCGNILIFLYDANYYQFKDNGLYVIDADAFYKNTQPLITINQFDIENEAEIYPLFVPRSDLINGEIIQLRLTGEEDGIDRTYSRKMLNFNEFSSTTGFTQSTIQETNSQLFLSLYNSFASVPDQYNTKTTTFFKYTTPTNTTKLKNVASWFQNGIECRYFRPGETSLTENPSIQTKKASLQLKASMIAKKDLYEDNSFIRETIEPNETNTYYTFAREQVYCAATRANLTFYSTAALDEKGQFIHSPLQLLMSAGVRGDSESIQAKRLVYTPEAGVTALDVMSKTGDTCSIEDIKNMLYRNAKEKNKPIHIEAIFGGRKVNSYIKKKKLKYVVIEKEPGTRHMLYGPTCVGLSFSNGFLSTGDGLTSVKEIEHGKTEDGVSTIVTWYDKTGTPVSYTGNAQLPSNAEYGVIDLTKLSIESVNNFMVRFYTSDWNNIGGEGEFQMKYGDTIITRRPIFKMAYFFGEDDITSTNE